MDIMTLLQCGCQWGFHIKKYKIIKTRKAEKLSLSSIILAYVALTLTLLSSVT